jgi:hypothetical protein
VKGISRWQILMSNFLLPNKTSLAIVDDKEGLALHAQELLFVENSRVSQRTSLGSDPVDYCQKLTTTCRI